jgi:uncharacterized protein (TIGR02117 family)
MIYKHVKFFVLKSLLVICLFSGAFASDTIYIVQEAWHTGIILKTQSVSPGIFPEIKRYEHKKYIDISWGDERYYQNPGANILLALRAVIIPTQAVIRYIGFSLPLQKFYKRSTIMQITLERAEFDSLCFFIAKSFQRTDNGQIIASHYGNRKLFFLAKRKYHLFRTCNTWVALALKKSGLPVNSYMALTASQLFRRLEKLDKAVYISEK